MSVSRERSWEELERDAQREYGEALLPDRHDDHPRTLVGTVTGYDQGAESTFSGASSWICTVEDRAGKNWSVWLNRAVLTSEWERHRPMPGERIAVRYRGVQQEASRQGAAPAHLHRLTVDRGQQLPDFLTRPGLEAAQQEGDVAIDTGGLPPAPSVDIPDADVVNDERDAEKGGEDDDGIPL